MKEKQMFGSLPFKSSEGDDHRNVPPAKQRALEAIEERRSSMKRVNDTAEAAEPGSQGDF